MVTHVEAILCISGDDNSDERQNWNIKLIKWYQNYKLLIASFVIDMNIPMTYKTNHICIWSG